MMKNYRISKKGIIIISLITILFVISCTIYAIQAKEKNNRKDVILTEDENKQIDTNLQEKTNMSKYIDGQLPEISDKAKQLLNNFNKDISKLKEAKKVYDNILKREVIRVTLEDAVIDFDGNGNIVNYKNLDDFSTIDKDKRNYNENEQLPKIDYKIKKSSDLSNTISLIESVNELTGYKIIECSNNIESTWILTWCRDYGNELINFSDRVSVMIDAKDGSVTLFGRNKMEPNTTVPILTQDEAIKLAKPIISKFDNANPDVKLTFCRPNFYWEEGSTYEFADYVRLSWLVSIKDCVSVEIDAETGENLGGGETKGQSVLQ